MLIQIVDERSGIRAQATLEPSAVELIELQLSLFCDAVQADAFLERLRKGITEALVQAVHYDLKPPSRAQTEYATVIAAALSVPLPAEVLRYRGHMHAFLDQHVALYRASRGSRGSTSSNRLQLKGGEPSDDLPF